MRTPGFWQGDRLPDSDAFPRIDLATAGAPSTGIMNLTGRFWLAPDELTTFVATQVLAVTDTTGEVGVITGAVVELSELGAPPPAGDDYVPPRDFTSERVEDDGTILRISTDYRETFGDQPLATAATERHGLARFAVPLDDVGGLIDVTIRRTLPTGPMFTTRHQWLATGDAPDLAVSVTIPDGSRPIVRHPIAVNLQERRLGTVQEPIRLVYADRCIPERQAVTAAEGKVNRIQTQLQELRDEFNRLPPSEREGLGRMIRRIEREDLPPVLAELRGATTARDACLGAP